MNKARIAKFECANWTNKICSGVMLCHKEGCLWMWVDKNLVDRECVADDYCEYFEKFVKPAAEKKKRN